jgi:hypothetical protein
MNKLIKTLGIAVGAFVMAFTFVVTAPPTKASAASCTLYNGKCCVLTTHRYGMHNACVGYIQSMINSSGTGRDYDGFKRLVVDNDFGPLTLAQVKAFQDYENIAKDGVVGRDTWTQLCYEAYLLHKMYPNTTTMTTAYNAGTHAGCDRLFYYY